MSVDSKVYTDFLSDLEEIYDNNDNLRNDDHNPLNHLFTHHELSKAIARAKKGKPLVSIRFPMKFKKMKP